ncbi:hypothetical protein SAMN05421678_108243 [Actinopolymorpha cephalotaxi]|uniref:Uncharacterized protein n=1 Tax=Actinopolymorpha cephalotaxi TaxID=504797 RepID=A0A1I2UMT6_9ACTN|nr:hypothetical protein SAMN05421678_108243 [Actinopolymorpha cephalotaxi]
MPSNTTPQTPAYGDEGTWPYYAAQPPPHCPGCTAPLGQRHHPRCSVQQCAECFGQRHTTCDCDTAPTSQPSTTRPG